MIPWGVAALLALALWISWIAPWQFAPVVDRTPIRLRFQLLAEQSLVTIDPSGAVISPDGRRLAYIARSGQIRRIYTLPLDQLEPTPLSGTEGARSLFFSPDGQWIGFSAERKLKKIPVSGGGPSTLCDIPGYQGASWGVDDTIVFANDQGIHQVSGAGGTPEQITVPDLKKGEDSHRFPQFLPDGKSVLFSTGIAGDFQVARIEVVSLESGDRKVVHQGGYFARYLPTGHLVFMQEATLFAAPFDLERMELTRSPTPVLEGVSTNRFGDTQYAFAQNGTLVYLPGAPGDIQRSLFSVDREGEARPFFEEPGLYSSPAFSPDGSRLALDIITDGNRDIWIYEIERGTRTRLTSDAAPDAVPIWSPDGQQVAFASQRDGPVFNLYWKPADGSGEVQRLTHSDYPQLASSFSPDGKLLAFTEWSPETRRDIWLLPLEGNRNPEPFLKTAFLEDQPSFSPDGRWIAYRSTETGQLQTYVLPYPGPGVQRHISPDFGAGPFWSRDGRELFYWGRPNSTGQATSLMVVPVSTVGTSFRAGTPRRLPDDPLRMNGGSGFYTAVDVAPDGKGFVVVRRGTVEENPIPTHPVVVLNWFEELKRLVPTTE